MADLPESTEEESSAFWRETGRSLVWESLTTLDETAKQLIAVSGILVGLYFHAITFSNLKGKVGGWTAVIYVAPIVLLLLTLICALIVFIPDHSRLNVSSWRASKLVYERTLKGKLLAVRLSSGFLVVGVSAVALAAVTYLGS